MKNFINNTTFVNNINCFNNKAIEAALTNKASLASNCWRVKPYVFTPIDNPLIREIKDNFNTLSYIANAYNRLNRFKVY